MKAIACIAAAVVLTACGSSAQAQLHSPSPPASPAASESSSPSKFSPVPIPIQETIASMRMTSLVVMWAATDSRILRSTDAGRHWTNVTPGSAARWSAFFAVDDDAAWAVVYSPPGANPTSFTAFRTTDGGRSWLRSSGPMNGLGATQITFVDRLHGWVYIDGGAAAGSNAMEIIRTTDGGATWSVAARSADPSTGQGTSGIQFGCDKGFFAFGSATVGVLPTSCPTSQQSIYRTTDGGLHWTSITLPPLNGVYGAYYYAPIFLTASEAVMAGGADLAVTHDGGSQWSVFKLPGTGTIDFDTPLSGWQLNDTISATSDGGRTWHAIGSPLPFKGTDLTLQYLGKGIAIAFWWHGTTAFRTDDGGRTWRSVAPAGLSS